MKKRAGQAYRVLMRDRNVYLAILTYLAIFILPNFLKLYIRPALYECVPFLKKYLFNGIMSNHKIVEAVYVVITASEIYRIAGLVAVALLSGLIIAKYLTYNPIRDRGE